MSKKIYCGIDKVPKTHKLGSMKECAEKKQVRYFGVKKIDPKLLEAVKKGSKNKESRDKLAIKMVGLRGKVSKLTKQMATEKDKKEKEKIKKDLDKTKDELTDVSSRFNKLEKTRKQSRSLSRGSKKSSRKGSSRKGSRKGSSRKGSRKGSRRGSRKGSRKGSRY